MEGISYISLQQMFVFVASLFETLSTAGHMEAAALLLNVGGNVHHETKYGYTALSHACANGHTSTAVMLIDRGQTLRSFLFITCIIFCLVW